MNILPNIRIGKSVCPHDCPSACALDVEILDAHTVGRLKGAEDNSYTLGVICEIAIFFWMAHLFRAFTLRQVLIASFALVPLIAKLGRPPADSAGKKEGA